MAPQVMPALYCKADAVVHIDTVGSTIDADAECFFDVSLDELGLDAGSTQLVESAR